MDKSNIAFGLITAILGVYIAVALVLSRVRENRLQRLRMHKTGRPSRADDEDKRSGPWTSFSS